MPRKWCLKKPVLTGGPIRIAVVLFIGEERQLISVGPLWSDHKRKTPAGREASGCGLGKECAMLHGWGWAVRCLHLTGVSLYYSLKKVCQIIVAYCMLHNLALRRQVPFLQEDGPDGGLVAAVELVDSEEEEEEEEDVDN
ncbi:hypothetical protein NDU88_008111 [Pleurodeles waltl]|uniref:DDE Tnp4 domain-containing protein n=1 Tax=Pleurodeles waltl TaxID=8319 RepID=A0AAV7PRY4_PLEWA|nr:hypothetical protein NDU88_008111 [Pleurodeles waltl]